MMLVAALCIAAVYRISPVRDLSMPLNDPDLFNLPTKIARSALTTHLSWISSCPRALSLPYHLH